VNYIFKYFRELTGIELHNIYYLRCLVFIVEQNCAYQDVDENDLSAQHVLLSEQDRLIAYTCILPPDKTSNCPRIGRVVVHPDFRGKKFGQGLMKTSIEKCKQDYPGLDIKISAQSHLKSFYLELGFISEGDEYLEDNIPHIGMRLHHTSSQIA
jgi:ElaA protein